MCKTSKLGFHKYFFIFPIYLIKVNDHHHDDNLIGPLLEPLPQL